MPNQYIDKESLKIIRDKLWAISNKTGITLEDIQDRTRFSYSQVYRILRGNGNTSVSNIIAVCKALETQPAVIFDFVITIPKYDPVRKMLKSKATSRAGNSSSHLL
nr:helix-turn-helix transcriptional regulator [Mucilaginibacter sp. L294]